MKEGRSVTAPKLHHYVPQFHLRRFADERGGLWAWDKQSDRMFRSSPSGIAAEKQFYWLTQYDEDGNDPLTMEKQLSQMEGEVSLITDQWLQWLSQMKALDALPIPRINRWLVARYLAVQMLRTLDTRDLVSAMAQIDRGEPVDAMEARELHTELMWDPRVVEKLTKRFMKSVWIFARNDSATPFVTSDNPVAFRSPDHRQWLRSLALVPGAYLVFALSPGVVLYCHPPVGPFRKLGKFANRLSPVVLDDQMVESENSGQVFMASRFVLSKRPEFKAERAFARTIGANINAPSN
ncbi:hypothetical protein CK222_03985 [Mesorhizobium sp. WSM3866]|nr:hypothetical protein CK214_24835 [Mesorhizobium sp. WSM3882]PBB37958.1 hypothetical protein CK221_08250 [Mesorhizobium sp. WSM3868]PBB45624.1 hypothetical protein CK222_03985 [Mesorhizobium sp. WSM3866]PBB58304.1 hypothetical protein CK217_30465 [Mesorhizobium loti]PBB85340.1 hypothetical protein CK216_19195 [Mesorhizobium sp. WSM3876]PBB90322.1 hypothetical protein CK215_21950 [Mesorhizobium sp. WSM3864]